MTKKVLIIDDEESFCCVVKDFLDDIGRFEVRTLTDPRQTLHIIKEFEPDIILLDLRMPHMGGFEVCQLLNDDEKARHVPIIITTALTDEGDVKEAFRLGVSAYLTKPIELKKLLGEIDDILNE